MRSKIALALIFLVSSAFAATITQLDGKTELALNFTSAGSKSVFLKIPKAASVVSADLDITGSSMLVFGSSSITGGSGNYIGQSVASGNFNGDSYYDLAVGTRNNKALVYYGSSQGFPAAPDLTINGVGANDNFGLAVLVKNMNGDSFDDLIVGAQFGDSDIPDSGSVYVFYGGSSGIRSQDNTTLSGGIINEGFGSSLAACDTNHDTYPDLIVGAPRYNVPGKTGAGRVYVIRSSASGVSTSDNITIDGRDPNENAGAAVACADFKGDGYGDVMIGAPMHDSGAGRVQVYYTADGNFGTTYDLTISGPHGSNQFGFSLSAGDVDNDNYPDLIVGNPYNSKVFIYKSSSSGISSTSPVSLNGPSNSQFGYSVSFVSDVNKDSYGDLLVGAPSSASTGQAFLYFGSPSGILSQNNRTLGEGASGDRFGAWASPIDLNAEGFRRFAVGASNAVSGKGKVYVYNPLTVYPSDPSIDVMADGSSDYSYTGSLSTTEAAVLTLPIREAVDACTSQPNTNCTIELEFSSESEGQLTINDIKIDYNPLGLYKAPCTSDSGCYSDYCGLNYSNLPTACCNTGKCWDSESSNCVDQMFLTPNKRYICTSTAEWEDCDSADDLLCGPPFLNILDKNFVCINASSAYKWVNTSSLGLGQFCGDGTHNCDAACNTTKCCANGKCGSPEAGNCSSTSNCCGGVCDLTGHCCPASKVFCIDACVNTVSEGSDCECSSQCPAGTLCSLTSNKCEEGGPCTTNSQCPIGSVCANNTYNTPTFCCSQGQCYNEASQSCANNNFFIPTSRLFCSQGVWKPFCSGGTLLVGPPSLLGKCSSDFCGADINCNNTVQGTDVGNYACTSGCNKTTQSLSLSLQLRRCPSVPITACSSNPQLSDNDTINYGTSILLNYTVLYPGTSLSNSNITILLDSQSKKSESSTGGMYLLENVTTGFHRLTVWARHSDYIDVSMNRTFVISRDIQNLVQASLSPQSASAQPSGKVDLVLVLTSIHSEPTIFIPSSNLPTNLPTSINVPAENTTNIPFKVTAPATDGLENFNLILTSSDGVLEVSATIDVRSTGLYSVKLTPILDKKVLSVVVENNGTLADSYTISSCVKTDSTDLAPTKSETVELGEIGSPCQVCAESANVKSCVTVLPIDFEITVPDTLDFVAGEPASFYFTTRSSEDGTISVSSNLPEAPVFDCSSNCNEELSFTPPSEPGTFQVTFTVTWPEYGITVRKTVSVTVSEATVSLSADQEQIVQTMGALQTEINALQASGIYVPAASKILDQVKTAQPKTPEEIAEILGQLEQAQRYIDFAKKTSMPEERPFPIFQLLIGITGLLFGGGAIYVVMFRKDLLDQLVSGAQQAAPPFTPTQPPYTRFQRQPYQRQPYQWPRPPAQGPGYQPPQQGQGFQPPAQQPQRPGYQQPPPQPPQGFPLRGPGPEVRQQPPPSPGYQQGPQQKPVKKWPGQQ